MITDLLCQHQKMWPLWTLNQEELVKMKSRLIQKLVVSLTENMNRIKACEEEKKKWELDVHLIKQKKTQKLNEICKKFKAHEKI